jgi:cellulose synthase/poly-beta-1,6-N-acetylglucosamine synthase-like glycosyltransferase
LITAHNEEAVIGERIENCLQQDYPQEKVEVIVASDHSTDRTEEIAQSFGGCVRVVRGVTGRGKSLTENDAVPLAKGDVILLSDADTRFPKDFLRKIAAPFSDPKIGCVTGKVLWKNLSQSTSTRSGDSYWRFEHYLWRLENALGAAFTGSGQCLAIRRELFRPIEAFFGDDTVIPLDILLQGRRVYFEETAVVYDEYFEKLESELRSRVRMSLRGLTGTLSRKSLFNPFKFGMQGAVILSHKILRYGTPYFMLALFLCNLLLVPFPLYRWVFVGQVLFYAASFCGLLLDRFSIHVPLISTAYSFAAANFGLLVGVTKGLFGSRIFAYRS